MSDTYLVLGSNSFTGAHFVEELLARGKPVIGVSRSELPHPAFLPFAARLDERRRAPGFEFHRLDLNHDTAAIAALARERRVPYVVNFAAQSMVAESWANPDHWFTTNVVATVRLHDELRKLDALRRYVHVSTPEVYGSCRGFVGPDAPFNPSTPYAVSRAACDMSLRTYLARYRFPVVFTRAANVFGPGQQLYRLVPKAALCGLTGKRLPLHGGGTSERSFIHVRDVCRGTVLAAEAGVPGETYHMATDQVRTIRAVVEEVARQLDLPFAKLADVAEERPGKDQAYLLDCALTKERLGWSPALSFEQGVAETIAWAKEHLAALRAMPLDYVHKA